MRTKLVLAVASVMVLAACSGAEEQAIYESVDAPESITANYAIADSDSTSAGPSGDATSDNASEKPAIGQPQIAYRYALGFRLPGDAIKPLQEKHADMCEALGEDKCRIISMSQSDSDNNYAYGNLQLAVAAGNARAFSKQIEQSSGSLDGELTSSSITGEDLSKQIVDTEAKLRARTLLRDRLMDILRTRRGTVAELVEAERGVAQVNQEIDQARSWLNEMRGRVAYSQMAIRYESGSRSSGGFTGPIRSAWNSLGGILGSLIGFLMMAAVVVIPIGLPVWAALRFNRWARRGSPKQQVDEVVKEAVEMPNES